MNEEMVCTTKEESSSHNHHHQQQRVQLQQLGIQDRIEKNGSILHCKAIFPGSKRKLMWKWEENKQCLEEQ